MNCTNCNNELKEGSKFCGKCGFQFENVAPQDNTQAPANNEANMQNNTQNTYTAPPNQNNYNQMPNQGVYNTQSSVQPKRTMIIGGSIAGAVALVIVSVVIFLNSGSNSFFVAANNTLKSAEKANAIYLKELPVLDHFTDISKSAYEIRMDLSNGFVRFPIDIDLDLSNDKMKASSDFMGYDYTVQLTKNTMILDTSVLDEIYGINFSTLNKDLKDNKLYADMFDEDLPDLNPSNWAKVPFIIYEIINDAYSKRTLDIIKTLEVEYEGKDEIEVFDKDINAKEFEVTVNPEAMAEIVYEIYSETIDEIIGHKDIAPYLEYLEEMSGESIVDELTSVRKRDFEDLYEEMFVEPIMVYTYKNQIVQIIFEENDDEVIVSFNPNTEVFIDWKVEMFTNSKSQGLLSMKLEDDEFEYIFYDGYSTGEITYDAGKSSKNFVIDIDGDRVTFDIDTSTKNVVEISAEIPGTGVNLELISTKGAKLNSWLGEKENTDYKSLLKLDEGELMNLSFQVGRLFW